MRPALLFAAGLLCGTLAPAEIAHAQREVAPVIVGAPFNERWPDEPYPRNIWTMQVFDGRLFLGAGNSSNFDPSPNAGPVPVVSYDGKRFRTEFSVDEEQISQFYRDGNVLLIPGHDSRDDWSFGNMYRRTDRHWTKVRNVPRGLHIYSVQRFRGRLIATGGSYGQPIDAWISGDDGANWKPAALLSGPAGAGGQVTGGAPLERLVGKGYFGRLWSLFELGDALYASATAPMRPVGETGVPTVASLFRFDPAQEGFMPIIFGSSVPLFPDLQAGASDKIPLVRRWARIDDQTVYIGGWQHNDHQWLPFGVYAATSLEQARRLPLPDDQIPWDILVHKNRLYCLTAKSKSEGGSAVTIFRFDRALEHATPILTFAAPTFARSFAVFRGQFYFGLGTETGKSVRLSEAAGTVLRTSLIP
jgi:hypothetical protein